MLFQNKTNGDIVTAHGPVADMLQGDPLSWERVLTEDEAAELEAEAIDESLELKGAALDDALEVAGLSKSGTADEKRARLAEASAALAVNAPIITDVAVEDPPGADPAAEADHTKEN